MVCAFNMTMVALRRKVRPQRSWRLYICCSPCPHYSAPYSPHCSRRMPLSVVSNTSRFMFERTRSSVPCRIFLATLAGLHNHVGQLLHLKVRINSNGLTHWQVWLSHEMFGKYFRMEATWLRYGYLVLPAHVIEDWQWLQDLGNAAGLGRGSWVVMLVQGQNLQTIITREGHENSWMVTAHTT